eukprot:m.428341 g.428341  ORF g.428341 m.428341 type:complete len:69 (-) comp21377_c1_seq7:276-482(-)
MYPNVILRISNRDEWQWLFWIAMIPIRVQSVGNIVSDSTILYPFFETVVNILHNCTADSINNYSTIRW